MIHAMSRPVSSRRWRSSTRTVIGSFTRASILFSAAIAFSEPSQSASKVFAAYIERTEARLAQQHQSPDQFLAPEDRARLRRGDLLIEKLTPADVNPPGAMLHHWRGSAFAPGATAADFDRLLRAFASYPDAYAPEVVRAKIESQDGDRYSATMRVCQKHVLTVVMDTSYEVLFGRLDPEHGFSISRSTKISEIQAPDTPNERTLSPEEDHGFLWRLNTYWTYEQADGGLYLQIESISLTRSIPEGLGWVARPFVESVPRESLEFTLRKTCDALKQKGRTPEGTR